MRFDDRVTLLLEVRPKDDLEDEASFVKKTVPCMRNSLTDEEQMGLFGKYDLERFKLHLQGVYDGFSSVIYQGQERMLKGKAHHKRSTVIYL